MAFVPPAASVGQLVGVDFSKAVDFATTAKAKFDAKDQEPHNEDPSKCKALLKFPGAKGPVFWSAKMAIDADGPAAEGAGHRSGTQLDPGNGQDQTSYRPFGGDGLASETIPYIVLPEIAPRVNQAFDPAIAIGDLAVVIFKNKISAAVCGDLGPFNKIGEASIQVHETLSDGHACPDPCTQRNAQGFCETARDSSVDEDVLYFVFPNSALPKGTLSYANINNAIATAAFALYKTFRGV